MAPVKILSGLFGRGRDSAPDISAAGVAAILVEFGLDFCVILRMPALQTNNTQVGVA